MHTGIATRSKLQFRCAYWVSELRRTVKLWRPFKGIPGDNASDSHVISGSRPSSHLMTRTLDVSYFLLARRFCFLYEITIPAAIRKTTQNRARANISRGTRLWFRLRLNSRVVQRKALRASSKRLQSHSGQAVGSLRQAKLRPESKQVGLLVSQKKAMEVRAFSTYWRGFDQNTQMTVGKIFRLGTTEPPVEVQKPITTEMITAAICTCTGLTHEWLKRSQSF